MTVRVNRDRILVAVEASKIRLINHRGYGHHSPVAITYFCCGGLTIPLPTDGCGAPTRVHRAQRHAGARRGG
jgi:hypothetical protein